MSDGSINVSAVISGVGCRLPRSENVEEFSRNLFEHVDMCEPEKDRYDCAYYNNIPRRQGQCKNVNRFDAAFFGIHNKQAAVMDPQQKMVLECAYEAIIDAGYTVEELDGSDTGVFVGTCESDASRCLSRYPETQEGYTVVGCSRTMFANRVSFTFNFKGPSFAIDTACSSSLYALHQALLAMRSGEVEKALVIGCTLMLAPDLTMQLHDLGLLGDDGTCRSFDAKAKGYVRSDGICALFIESRSTARRIYAELINTGCSSDGYKKKGILFPAGEEQAKLMRKVYAEANVTPEMLTYVEAHGTGSPMHDPEEAFAISSVLCEGRKEPLLMGSVKSNIGHCEPTGPAAGILKVIIAMREKEIPANMHFEEPNPNIPSLLDGRLKIVAENTRWNGGYVGVNSFVLLPFARSCMPCIHLISGIGGSNAHLVMRSPTINPAPAESIALTYPYILTYSARTQSGVERVFERLKQEKFDPYLMKLVAQTANVSPRRNPFRGYAVLTEPNPEMLESVIKKVDPKKQIWFVYTGMGAQWFGMGRDLLALPPFNASIQESAKALHPLGIQLSTLLTDRVDLNLNEEALDFADITEVFVSLVAIQIAITDTLAYFGVKPDGLMGHSVGEIAATYADGAITRGQAMQIAYYRAKVIVDAQIPEGKMLSAGLSPEDAKTLLETHALSDKVVVACVNTKDSVTFSGTPEGIDKLTEQLETQGLFARPVDSFSLAFHSPQMQPCAQTFTKYLEKIIPAPLTASGKFRTTSAKLPTDEPLVISPEYFVNNMICPVQFYEAAAKIPDQSVIVEIGPAGILQAVLKRCAPPTCTVLDSMRKAKDDHLYLLNQVGVLYMNAVNLAMQLEHVPYPVPLGTSMLNSLIEWDHSVDWPIETEPIFHVFARCQFDVHERRKEDHFYLGHSIDGEALVPLAAFVYYAWMHSCRMSKKKMFETPVVFRNVIVHNDMPLVGKDLHDVVFAFNYNKGEFFFSDGTTVYATGRVEVGKTAPEFATSLFDEDKLELTRDDIYREFAQRGFNYKGHFKGLLCSDLFGAQSLIEWRDHWTSFLDSLTQLSLLWHKGDTLRMIRRVDYIAIDPIKHTEAIRCFNGVKVVEAHRINWQESVQAGGVLIKNANGPVRTRKDGTMITDEALHGEVTCAMVTTFGKRTIDEMCWVESHTHQWLHHRGGEGTRVAVYVAGLNAADASIGRSGLSELDCFTESNAYGFEFSGRRLSDGKRLVGSIPTRGTIGTFIDVDERLTVGIPDNWSMEDAATVHVAYTTGYYAMVVKGRMRKGQKILIQDGASDVGMAAIRIAKGVGCEVFTTVDSEEKKKAVQKFAPSIPDDHILSFETPTFLAHILERTNNRGVDIVLNTLRGDLLLAGVECLAQDGRFLEVGEYDMMQSNKLGMKCFLRNIHFVGVVAERLRDKNSPDWTEVLRLYLDGIRTGVVQPLPRLTFSKEHVREAYRLLASGKESGKFLIKIREEERGPNNEPLVVKPEVIVVPARRMLLADRDEVFVVVGSGGDGLAAVDVAQWLIRRGAKKLLVTSEQATGYEKRAFAFWRSKNVRIDVSKVDASKPDDAKQLLDLAQSMGPLAGIYLVMPEEVTARNMDALTRTQCGKELKRFVLLSACDGRSVLDAIVEQRRADGLCGNSIQWGPVAPEHTTYALSSLEKLLLIDLPSSPCFTRAHALKAQRRTRELCSSLARVIGMSPELLPQGAPLGVLDNDPLMVVELQQVLAIDYGIDKSEDELRKITPRELKAMVDVC